LRPCRKDRNAIRAARPHLVIGRAILPARFQTDPELLPAPAAATASATTAAATASATVTIAATTAARAGPLFASLVHLDVAALELGAVEFRDCARRFIGIGHLHEAEPARLAGELVGYNRDTIDLSDLSK
jgi:hypothetical protein